VIRINLLPPEVIQKRKDESRWKWVVLAAVVLLAALAGFYMVMLIQVASKQGEVAAVAQQAQTLQAQTERFRIFQQKESDLTARKSIVETAEMGRVDWARMFNELSLVLPSDVYLTSLTAAEPDAGGAVQMVGKAVDESDNSFGLGFKPVAKMMVRLTELAQLDNVWLTNASRVTASSGVTTATGALDLSVQPNLVDWTVTALVTKEGTPTAAGAPAPPPPAP
jgi:Tfp pilus assembly protein PilN